MLPMLKFKLNSKITALALITALPLFLVGCTIKDLPLIGDYFNKSTKKEGALNIWGMWESPQVMSVLSSEYTTLNPDVVINYDDRSVLSPLDLKERVFSRANQEDAGVDIMFVHNSWVPRLKDRLAPMPSSIMSVADYGQRFYSSAVDSAVIEGEIYGVPIYYDGLVLVYNKDHFDEVGQFEAPTSWEELRKLALELKIIGPQNELIRAGVAMGTADNIDFFSDILGLMFSQAGVVIPGTVDSKPAQDALEYYTLFTTTDGVWNNSLPEASVAFAEGKVSMIFVPSWKVLDILEARPDMNIAVAPVPQARPDQQITWGTFWMGVVPISSSNPGLAWDYLNFISSDDQQKVWFSEASKLRAFGPAYSSKNIAQDLSGNKYVAPVLVGADSSKSAEIASRSGNRRQTDVLKDAVNSILSKTATPAEALEVVKVELSR